MFHSVVAHGFVVLSLLSLSACETVDRQPGLERPSDIQRLLQQAENSSNRSRQASLRLQASEALVAQSAFDDALTVLSQTNLDQLNREQQDRAATLTAVSLQQLDRLVEAQAALGALSRWQADDYLLLGDICRRLAQHQCAADGLIQASLAAGFSDEALPDNLHDQIWSSLTQARRGPAAFVHRYHHAWWLLQQQIRSAGSVGAQIQAWQSWQQQYPSHPARIRPPAALLKLDNYEMPDVAILLPLTGPYAAAGAAARDGFIAAYLRDADSAPPRVKFFDTGQNNTASLWEQVLVEDFDVVIGPLIKQHVDEFVNASRSGRLPRLVLNYLDQRGEMIPDAETASAPASLYQFGIAIEDEATSLSNYLLEDGHQRVLIVHSQDSWSRRALDAYAQNWPYPLAEAVFTDIKGLTSSVGDAMQVAASDQRHREISNILGQSMEFAPRARQDLDAVVALTSYVESQSLVPALRYHFADHLPVYATSQSVRGNALKSLAGFQLTEMPLFADGQQPALQQAFNLSSSPVSELYALGFDAYQLATWLPILDAQSQAVIPASSGRLVLRSDGHFRRELPLAEIDADGQLETLIR